MGISLLQISLLRFFKTFKKHLVNSLSGQFISLMKFFGHFGSKNHTNEIKQPKKLPNRNNEINYISLRQFLAYSRVLNKRTGRLLENGKKSHLYALIRNYTFINFQQKVPPIRLFPPILLLIYVLSLYNSITFLLITTSDDLRSHFKATYGNQFGILIKN